MWTNWTTSPEPGLLGISVTLQVGTWHIIHHQVMPLEQRANMRDDLFSNMVERMLAEAFAAFQKHHGLDDRT